MLQKALSNRPSGAVALLLIAASLVLNLLRGENILVNSLWQNEMARWAVLSCYAQRTTSYVKAFLEETLIGKSSDYGFEKKNRKVVEISLPEAQPAHASHRVTI